LSPARPCGSMFEEQGPSTAAFTLRNSWIC